MDLAVLCLKIIRSIYVRICHYWWMLPCVIVLQTSGGVGVEDGFSWTDGPVMCMLAARAGPDRLITLFAATTDKRLVISSYLVFLLYCYSVHYCVTSNALMSVVDCFCVVTVTFTLYQSDVLGKVENLPCRLWCCLVCRQEGRIIGRPRKLGKWQ